MQRANSLLCVRKYFSVNTVAYVTANVFERLAAVLCVRNEFVRISAVRQAAVISSNQMLGFYFSFSYRAILNLIDRSYALEKRH